MPLMLAEFIKLNYLIMDIPAEHTLEEFGRELLRRVDDTLRKYEDCYVHNERVLEEPKNQYATPYNNMVTCHMECWNDIVIDAISVLLAL